MCCIVTGGADFLKRYKEKDGLIFFSVPGFVVICFAFGKMFYIYLICMSKQYTHTHGMALMCRSEDNFHGSILYFLHVNPGN